MSAAKRKGGNDTAAESAESPAQKKSKAASTVDEMLGHRLTVLGGKTWHTPGQTPFDAALVRQIYNDDLLESDTSMNNDFAATGVVERVTGYV
jgi:hypothetical protein